MEPPRARTCLTGPLALAAAVTLANAFKPVVVDDAAYLAFARHIAYHPFDPYGFDLFWYTTPDRAMDILAPPVLPYWLALGIRLFGENVVLLKLWLYPFLALLAWSLRALLRRFARGVERPALVLLLFSPAVLPTANLMLDVPALALGLSALALFLLACDRGSVYLAVAAGLVAALAVQTKYTMLLLPVVILWYGVTARRAALAALTVAVGVLAFAGWEGFLEWRYGESHFLHHVHGQSALPDAAGGPSALERYLRLKEELVPPLFAYLGCMGGMLSFWAGRAAGFSRRVVSAAGLFALVGVLLVVLLPYHMSVLVPGKTPGHDKLILPALVWRSLGAGAAVTLLLGASLLLMTRGGRRRRSRDSLFLIGWVLIEIAGYFVLSPFPAGRRLVGVVVVVGLVLARVVSRVGRARPERRPPAWVVPAAVAWGLAFALLDAHDAGAERTAAEQAVADVHAQRNGRTAWYVGHWGFGYYCGRAGLRHYDPAADVVRPGELLVLPDYDEPYAFTRPFPGWGVRYQVAEEDGEKVAVIVIDDAVSGRTVPNFYGGIDPIVGRDRPRLGVGVYRMKREWSPRP